MELSQLGELLEAEELALAKYQSYLQAGQHSNLNGLLEQGKTLHQQNLQQLISLLSTN